MNQLFDLGGNTAVGGGAGLLNRELIEGLAQAGERACVADLDRNLLNSLLSHTPREWAG